MCLASLLSLSLGVPNPMEVPKDSIVVRISEAVSLFLPEDEGKFEHVLDRERWDVLLDELETVYILVGFFLRQNRWLVEPSKTVDQSLKCFLIPLTVTLVLCLAKLF